jgi:hypothetical protein
VETFLNSIVDPVKRQDSWTIHRMMSEIAQSEARMWGEAIVGYGSYTLTAANGQTSVWPLIGFSPRKQALTLYLSLHGAPGADDLLGRLGKHSLSKSCLYIKRLADVDVEVLGELVRLSYERSFTELVNKPVSSQ